eukprot:914515_1
MYLAESVNHRKRRYRFDQEHDASYSLPIKKKRSARSRRNVDKTYRRRHNTKDPERQIDDLISNLDDNKDYKECLKTLNADIDAVKDIYDEDIQNKINDINEKYEYKKQMIENEFDQLMKRTQSLLASNYELKRHNALFQLNQLKENNTQTIQCDAQERNDIEMEFMAAFVLKTPEQFLQRVQNI